MNKKPIPLSRLAVPADVLKGWFSELETHIVALSEHVTPASTSMHIVAWYGRTQMAFSRLLRQQRKGLRIAKSEE